MQPSRPKNALATPLIAVAIVTGLAALFLLGLAFGRVTGCTTDVEATDCSTLKWALAGAQLTNLATAGVAVVAILAGARGRTVLVIQVGAALVLGVAAVLLTAPGVLWT